MTPIFSETTLVFGHRGASHDAPENTLPAFELARQQGADGIELDVHLSADGELIVIHNNTVDKTTNGVGEVSGLTTQQIKALDAGSWFDSSFSGTPVPTLDEVLIQVGQDLCINIEIKSPDDGIEQAVIDSVKRHRMIGRVVVSSFNPLILQRFRNLTAEIPIGFLTAPDIPPEVAQMMMGVEHEARHPEQSMIDTAYVNAAQQHGYRVHTWTVNDPERARELQTLGVDVIITDRPNLIREALGR